MLSAVRPSKTSSVAIILSVIITIFGFAYSLARPEAFRVSFVADPAHDRLIIAQVVGTPSATGVIKPTAITPSISGGQASALHFDPQTMLPVISAIVVILASFITSRVTLQAADKSLWQKANDEECKRLEKSLDQFYFPFLQLSEVSYLLSQDLRDRLNDPDYRMLIALMKPGWKAGLSVGNQPIVEEVCKNGKILEKLIYEHAGAVDEPILEYLGRASAHYRMLNLAYDNKLGSDMHVFERYVFPDHLHDVLRMQIKFIRDRCAYLRANPAKPPPVVKPAEIPGTWALAPWPDPPRKQFNSTIDRRSDFTPAGENYAAAEDAGEVTPGIDRQRFYT